MDLISQWTWTSWGEAGLVVASAAAMVVLVIVVIRVVGLRSLSKMSGFDFVVTVAIGSVVASTVATSTPIAQGFLAVAALLGVQAIIALIRLRGDDGSIVDNTPLLLMRDGELIPEAMCRARVTESDVRAKLREANVLTLSQVRAVVLETTGDISVLHGDGPVDAALLDAVRDVTGRDD